LGGDGLFDVADQHLAVQQPPRLGRDEELKLSSPATARNREPIAAVLADWLPKQGLVLEVASGAGEHAAFFAQMFPDLDWQPSDPDPQALTSIEAWRADSGFANLRQPLILDAASATWPVDQPVGGVAGPARWGGARPASRGAADSLRAMAGWRHPDRAVQPDLRCRPEAPQPRLGPAPCRGFRARGGSARAGPGRAAADAGE
jgi:hypothetical protein